MAGIPKNKLNNGLTIPAIGFGTWHLEVGQEVESAVKEALSAGYRLIDTAKLYGNEVGTGRAIKNSGIAREEIFITTKLWNTDHGYDNALKAFNDSLERLDMDYVDLYLIHWPASEKLLETWQALCEIYGQGRAKSIGVSNYSVLHLQELLTGSDIPPAVNQLEFNPFVFKSQKPLVDYCLRNNIAVMAYSPLSRGAKIDNPAVGSIAAKHTRTPAQILLRWAFQHGTIPIPKSAHPERIRENLDIFGFELSGDDMQKLDELSEN